ncbi:hypothetical protein HDU82_003131 [Entophlyctis luteolus]|nr:hypothetical protein HDU82_003131 [Entophlyctis luteolus]
MRLNAKGTLPGTAGSASPVQCVQSNGKHLVACGTSEGVLRVHDLESPAASAVHTVQLEGGPVGAVSFDNGAPPLLVVGAGPLLTVIDIRGPGIAVVAAAPDAAADDINSVHASFTSGPTHAVAADDAGDVRVFDLRSARSAVSATLTANKTVAIRDLRTVKSLREAHSNLCLAAAFEPPRQQQQLQHAWTLWSGGCDHAVRRWDYSNGALLQEWSMLAATTSTPQSKQAFNPPFVTALAPDPAGSGRIAAALGSGAVALFSPPDAATATAAASKKKKKSRPYAFDPVTDVLRDLHSWSCSAVQFFGTSGRRIVTGGLDGRVGLVQLSESGGAASTFAHTRHSVWPVGRKVDSLCCIESGVDSNSGLLLVAGCAMARSHGALNASVDFWDATFSED